MASRDDNRQRMIEAVRAQLVDHPFEQLGLNGIAEAADLSLWALRYHFENVDGLFRTVAHDLIERVAGAVDYQEPPAGAVVDAIRDYGAFVAELMQGRDYRDLVYLVIRNGRHHLWLKHSYEERVVGRICRTLEEVIRRAGERHGVTVLLREHAARRFHSRIEAELVLASLLPPTEGQEPADLGKLLRDIARDTFEATYVFEWAAATAA
jgi:AcrR family transcriptional regulator